MYRLRKPNHFGRVRGRRRGRNSLMASNAGPALLFAAVVLAVIGAIAAIVIFAVPPALELLGLVTKPTPTPTPEPTPRPTLMQIQKQPLSTIQKEVVIQKRYASHPMVLGNQMLFSSGTDEGGNPKMNNLYFYDMDTNTTTLIEGLKMDGSDFLYPTMNQDWIVFLDSRRDGGGWIKAFDRAEQKQVTVKRVYIGTPIVRLAGNLVFWIERTGTRMDKLFAYDLKTQESVAIDVFDNSIYGQSSVGACETQIVWANADPEQGVEEALLTPKSVLHTLDVLTGERSSYASGMYVHDPQTNGQVHAWVNANYSPEAALYIRMDGKEPELVAEGVSGFGLGDNFIAYGKDEAIWVYIWGNGVKQAITTDKEKGMFLSVSSDYVMWLDITLEEERSSRDILKYAPIE